MKADIWRELYHIVKRVSKHLPRGSRRVPDSLVVLTLLWAALNDSPISWAVQRRNWPVWCQRMVRRVPSSTTMSRRLRKQSVVAFLDAVLQEAQKDLPSTIFRVIDGKPLPISSHSRDKQAGYGRAAGGKAKGYKLHYLQDSSGKVIAWRVAQMNTAEQKMAARMLRDNGSPGYLLADAGYEGNPLSARARVHGTVVVAPRTKPFSGLGKGPNRHDPMRLRGIELTEGPSRFGRNLLRQRKAIERTFGVLTSFGGGLGHLPAWVRGYRRVHRWVAAKLAINCTRMLLLRLKSAA